MKRKQEIVFAFDKGIETDKPEVTSSEMKLSELDNYRPVYSRLRTLHAHSLYVAIADENVVALAYSFNLGTRTLNFYAISDDKVYNLVIADGLPTFILSGSYLGTELGKVSWASWEESVGGSVYFTKRGTYLSKLETGVLSEVGPTWDPGGGTGALKLSARYCATIDNRLVMANITASDGSHFIRRVQWSDLYNPEDFDIVRGKEGDLFDLEVGNLEITGIFNHRGYMTIFTRSGIWRAAYVGYPKVYRFDPVYSDFGCMYHHSAISSKELIFFIGDDNFYALDGFTPRPIGKAIWNYWNEQSVNKSTDDVVATVDPFNSEVMWKFRRKAQDDVPLADYRSAEHFWLLVYNYQENRWSTRTADGMNCFYNNKNALRGFEYINQFHSTWNNEGKLTSTVGIDDYPWGQLIFTAQVRATNVVTVTSAAHGLTSGNLVTIIGSTPADLNKTLTEVTVTGVDAFTYVAAGADGAASVLGTSDFHAIDGDWQFFDFPTLPLVGRLGEVSIYHDGEFTDFLGLPIEGVVVSQELFLGSLLDVKELTEVKLAYQATGSPVIQLHIGHRDDQSSAMTWEGPYTQSTLSPDNEKRFILSKGIRGKLFTVKLVITNTATDYVEEMNGGSLLLAGLKSKGTEV